MIDWKYNKARKCFNAELPDMIIISDNDRKEAAELAEAIANAYRNKQNDVAAFLTPVIAETFGHQERGIFDQLGKPEINISNETVTYLQHSFDSMHIISFEYAGKLDKLLYPSIDG